jgi:hypothetical protein
MIESADRTYWIAGSRKHPSGVVQGFEPDLVGTLIDTRSRISAGACLCMSTPDVRAVTAGAGEAFRALPHVNLNLRRNQCRL